MNRRARTRLHNLAYYLLLAVLLGLLAWLSQQHRLVLDWSADRRNSLGPASIEVLSQLSEPLAMEVFIGPAEAPRAAIRELVGRYRQHKPDLALVLVDPRAQPSRVRELGVRGEGEMILRYGNREERLQQISESSLTNALRRLARGRELWLGFVEGHGERSPAGSANHDLGQFAARLHSRGLRPGLLNLVRTPTPPDNLAALVLAGPQTDYLPGELASLRRYLEDGGRLALLIDPQRSAAVQPLLNRLGLTVEPGVVMGAGAARYGIDDASYALVTDYPSETVTAGFSTVTLFPQAAALRWGAGGEWRAWPILRTSAQSWNETGPLRGPLGPAVGEGESLGERVLGYALSRPFNDGEQRVLVVGDGDFLSNAFLGNGGNLELGLVLMEWLVGDADRRLVEPPQARDRDAEIPATVLLGLALASLVAVPAALLLGGLLIWRRRRG